MKISETKEQSREIANKTKTPHNNYNCCCSRELNTALPHPRRMWEYLHFSGLTCSDNWMSPCGQRQEWWISPTKREVSLESLTSFQILPLALPHYSARGMKQKFLVPASKGSFCSTTTAAFPRLLDQLVWLSGKTLIWCLRCLKGCLRVWGFLFTHSTKCGAGTGHMKLSQTLSALKHHGPYPHAPVLEALESQCNTGQISSGNLVFSADQLSKGPRAYKLPHRHRVLGSTIFRCASLSLGKGISFSAELHHHGLWERHAHHLPAPQNSVQWERLEEGRTWKLCVVHSQVLCSCWTVPTIQWENKMIDTQSLNMPDTSQEYCSNHQMTAGTYRRLLLHPWLVHRAE